MSALDSRTMVGEERKAVLLALARCKHARRLGYRSIIAAQIEVHKEAPDIAYSDDQADAFDLVRFVYRHQLQWPVGIYEPPISRCTGKEIGLVTAYRARDGKLYFAADENGDAVWRRWDGRVPAPLSGECRI